MRKKLQRPAQTLRNPGQSLDEEIERTIHDDFMGYFLLAMLMWVICLLEWLGQYLHLPRQPGIYAGIAILATGVCVWKFRSTRRYVRDLRQGRDGERAVAEVLDDLRRHGAEIIHDIPDEKGNVDHVLICRRGIYVLETKNWTKSEGRWELTYDGEQVHVEGRPSEAAPIIQCKAEVRRIRDLLLQSTSKKLPVQGVVLFVGWFLTSSPTADAAPIWVLNPKQLKARIRQAPRSLTKEEVAMATLHLKQYVKRLAA